MSLWEIAIKVSIGKLTLVSPFSVLIPQQMRLNKIELLDLTVEHLATVLSLPFHHRDPFDRLIIAQAMVEEMILVSNDVAVDAYPIKRLW